MSKFIVKYNFKVGLGVLHNQSPPLSRGEELEAFEHTVRLAEGVSDVEVVSAGSPEDFKEMEEAFNNLDTAVIQTCNEVLEPHIKSEFLHVLNELLDNPSKLVDHI